jgi:hypothetical protein
MPLEQAAEGLLTWRKQLNAGVTSNWLEHNFPDVLHRLEPLTGGARPRELLVQAGPHWTAYFDCSLRGTDAVSTISYLSRTMRCQGLAVRTVPHTVGLPGIRQGRYGAVQFELFGPQQTSFLNYVRTISVLFDGNRWVFDANGIEQWFERPEAYKARRVRDRFTTGLLEEYCRKLGIDVFNPDVYGPTAVLVESAIALPSNGLVMTLAEAQEWLEIVPDMANQLPG